MRNSSFQPVQWKDVWRALEFCIHPGKWKPSSSLLKWKLCKKKDTQRNPTNLLVDVQLQELKTEHLKCKNQNQLCNTSGRSDILNPFCTLLHILEFFKVRGIQIATKRESRLYSRMLFQDVRFKNAYHNWNRNWKASLWTCFVSIVVKGIPKSCGRRERVSTVPVQVIM